MSRNQLRVTQLERFKEYLDLRGVKHRPGRGIYEVLQVLHNSGQWTCVFRRDHMPEHYTVDRRMDQLVENFIAWSRTCSTLAESTPPSGT